MAAKSDMMEEIVIVKIWRAILEGFEIYFSYMIFDLPGIVVFDLGHNLERLFLMKITPARNICFGFHFHNKNWVP